MDTKTFILNYLKATDIYPFVWRYYINKFQSGWTMPAPHTHEPVEFIYTLNGSGYLKCKQNLTKMTKGNCLVINSNVPHHFYVEKNQTCTLINIHFLLRHPDQKDDTPACSFIDEFTTNFFGTALTHNGYLKFTNYELENLMRRIVCALDERHSESEILVKLYISELLIHLSHIFEEKRSWNLKASNAYVAEAKKYIECSLSLNLSPAGIAKMLHISPDYLLHIFKKQTGYSLMEYITAKRIAISAELLRTTAKTITEIAFTVGIPNSQYFSTLFKKHTGMSPNQYRRISPTNNHDANIFI